MLNQNCIEDNIFTYKSKEYGRMIGWTINCVFCSKLKESCLPIIAEAQFKKWVLKEYIPPTEDNICQPQI